MCLCRAYIFKLELVNDKISQWKSITFMSCSGIVNTDDLHTPSMFTYDCSLDTRLNTFVFLYIACCLHNFTVLAESSLVLNFLTRCLLLVYLTGSKLILLIGTTVTLGWLNNSHKRIQQCCHLANLKSTRMT